jgi:hypothetical protein
VPPVRVGAIDLYRRIAATCRSEAGRLLATAAIVFIPLGLVEALGEKLIDVDLDSLTELEIAALAVAAVAQGATALLGEVFYSGAVAAIIVGARTGGHRPLREIARELPYGRLFAVDLLFSIALAIGLLLLIVPGIVFLTYFALSAPAVEIENRGVWGGFRRSAQLVRGRFWTVLAVVLPITVGVEILSEFGGSVGESLLGHNLLGAWLGATTVEILATPVYAVAVVVMTIALIEERGERLPGSAAAD